MMGRKLLDFLRRHRIVILTIGLLCLGVIGWHTDELEKDWGLTGLFWARGSIAPPEGAAIIDIQAVGKGPLTSIKAPKLNGCSWTDLDVKTGPWPRCAYAILIDKLNELGAVTLSFDINFSSDGKQNDNELLADSIRRAQNVMLLVKANSQVTEHYQGHKIQPINATIRKYALGQAPFILPKSQSIYGFPSIHTISKPGATLPTLTLFAFDEFKNRSKAPGLLETNLHTRFSALYENWIQRKPLPDTLSATQKNILTGPRERYFNIYGGPGTLPVYSGIDILHGKIQPDLTGLSVFIGQAELNRIQQDDSFPTVFTDTRGIYLSGVELAGTAFLNLMHDDDVKRLNTLFSLVLLAIFAGTTASLAFRLRFGYNILAILGLTLVYGLAAYLLFVFQNIWIPTASVIICQAAFATAVVILFYLAQLRNTQSKVIPSWAEDFVREEGDEKTRFGTANAICWRSDLSGYTRLGQEVSTPEYHLLMNKYFDATKATVDKWNGNFANPADDSYIVFWPIDRKTTKKGRVHDACRAALDASQVLVIQSENGETHELRPRIGLSYGEIAMGPVGGENAFGFNITGNTVNLTARIENSNKTFGTKVLCDASLGDLDDQLLSRPLGRFLLRDQIEPNDLIEILDLHADASALQKKLVSDFANALSSFQNHEYQTAQSQFKSMLDAFPDDGPTKFYVEYLDGSPELSSPTNEIPIIRLDQKT